MSNNKILLIVIFMVSGMTYCWTQDERKEELLKTSLKLRPYYDSFGRLQNNKPEFSLPCCSAYYTLIIRNNSERKVILLKKGSKIRCELTSTVPWYMDPRKIKLAQKKLGDRAEEFIKKLQFGPRIGMIENFLEWSSYRGNRLPCSYRCIYIYNKKGKIYKRVNVKEEENAGKITLNPGDYLPIELSLDLVAINKVETGKKEKGTFKVEISFPIQGEDELYTFSGTKELTFLPEKKREPILDTDISEIQFKRKGLDEILELFWNKLNIQMSYSLTSELKEEVPRFTTIFRENFHGILLQIANTGHDVILKENRVTILPEDWEKDDRFLNMKIDLVKQNADIEEIIDYIFQEYRERHKRDTITEENKKGQIFLLKQGSGKDTMKINIIVSDTTVLDVLEFLSDINKRFIWRIDKNRTFTYDFINRPRTGEKKRK